MCRWIRLCSGYYVRQIRLRTVGIGLRYRATAAASQREPYGKGFGAGALAAPARVSCTPFVITSMSQLQRTDVVGVHLSRKWTSGQPVFRKNRLYGNPAWPRGFSGLLSCGNSGFLAAYVLPEESVWYPRCLQPLVSAAGVPSALGYQELTRPRPRRQSQPGTGAPTGPPGRLSWLA